MRPAAGFRQIPRGHPPDPRPPPNQLKSGAHPATAIQRFAPLFLLSTSVVVLFLLLGLFSDNIKTLAANSGVLNVFKRNNSIEKTYYKKSAYNPTQITMVASQTASQSNVQVTADQGLDYYKNKSEEILKNYIAKLPDKQVTVSREDLARWLTIAKICGSDVIYTPVGDSGTTLIEYAYNNYGISVKYNTDEKLYYTLIINDGVTKKLDYNTGSTITVINDNEKLATVKLVINNNFT